MRFLKCEKCNTILGSVDGDVTTVSCCGELAKELMPNTVDASQEKHVPVFEINNNIVTVTVGSTIHPMSEEHHIAWVAIETEEGFQRKNLQHTAEPVLVFALTQRDRLKSVYAYCNLHGLWRADV